MLAGARRRDALRRDDVAALAEGVGGDDRQLPGARQLRFARRSVVDALSELPVERHTILPESIWSPVAKVCEQQISVTARIGLSAGSATVEASPGGDDGSVAMEIAATRSVEVVPIPARWVLTAAEERVAAAVVEGHGNRAVADTLSISAHTLEWHLRHIVDKLGVRSRAQLSTHYFADQR